MIQSRNGFICDFYKNFHHLRETPVVLYGIGQFTRQIVEQATDFQIMGLMDAKTTGQVVYGLKVLSEHEAGAMARAVIIVSNLSVADIIYRRIEAFTNEKGIEVYYLNGLKPQKYDDAVAKNPYWEKNEKELRGKILENEVISFDIFDTLLMRKCQRPEDIFRFVAYEMKNKGVKADFPLKRKEAEKICYRQVTKYFDFGQIYKVLCEEGVVSEHELKAVMEKELEVEKRFTMPRKCVCELLEYAKEQGKTVILTSDMYLLRDALEELLLQNGICRYDELLISCEVKKDKYWGSMWEHVTALYPGRKVLHIGDNEISDEKTAREHGILTYRIAGADALLDMSGINRHMVTGKSDGDCLLWGLFAAKAGNNPFGMNKTKGRLYISNMFEFGYLFFAPLILNYLLWLVKTAEKQQVDTILFVARDGYLLEKLYRKIVGKKDSKAPKAIYYLSSRRAASVASIETEEDIWFIFDKLCSTAAVTYEKVLEKGFGIQIDWDDEYLGSTLYETGKEKLFRHTVNRYAKRIFENAGLERANYFKYLEKLPLGERLGFVNFVCRGVTQRCTSKLMKKRLKGFYFASEEDILDIYPHMEDIFCLYGENLSTHTSRLNLMAKYLFGETILSAPEGQLICFSEEGMPVYEERKKSFAGIQECHKGIQQYIDDIQKTVTDLPDWTFSSELTDQMFGAFDLKNVILSREVKECFSFEDYYGE